MGPVLFLRQTNVNKQYFCFVERMATLLYLDLAGILVFQWLSERIWDLFHVVYDANSKHF